jgi:hypothetical protein
MATVSVKIADTPAVKAAILAAYERGWSDGYGQGRDDEADGLPLRALSDSRCTCSLAWAGHPNPHATTCPEHVR